MEHILELHEFFVEGGNPDRSHVLLHITEPSSPSEMQKGYFFALIEIVGGSPEQIEHLQLITDTLETGYYETDDTPEKDAFELTIEYVNRRSHHILNEHGAMITCLVGVLRGHTLSFAYHGTPVLSLLYGDDTTGGIMNLCDGTSSRDQLFSSITQGTLNSGDYIYAATPHTTEYLSIDRIKKIITGRPTRHAAEHVEKVLKDLRNGISFGGLMLHILKKPEIPKTGPRPKPIVQPDDVDVVGIDERRAKTQQILSPPLITGVRERMQSYKEEKKRSATAPEKRTTIETNHRARQAPKPSVSNQILVTVGQTLVGGLIALAHGIKRVLIFFGKILIGFFLLISNRGGQRETVINAMRETIRQRKQWLSDLPLLSKILFLLTIVLAITFVSSIGIIRVRENRQAIAQQYITSVQAIKDKQGAAEASLIYDDRDKALLLLQEAQILLADLPENTPERKDTKTELKTLIEKTLLSLRNMTLVSLTPIVDLTSVNEQVHVTHIASIDNQLVAYGPDESQLYFIDPRTSQTSVKPYAATIHLENHSTPKEDDEIVFATRDQGIAVYNKETTVVTSKDITHANDQAALADICIYNQRLYGVDVANNQLFRYSKTQTGYDKGTPWITDNADISDATSVAIDGDIFILKASGQILKFAKGAQEEFTISGLDPQLDNPSILWTYNDVQNLYILEPTNKRVVVLDKKGKLIKQYTANEWQQPTGMVVDEAKGVVYILDTNSVYSFSL